MKLKGSTVIVTGASRGIGRETARRFARAGSNVVLASGGAIATLGVRC
jgi:citronellol/citronellal dehydrogenase